MFKRIAYITDIHLDEDFPISQGVNARQNWKTILEDIAAKNISHLIFGGDIGTLAANAWFFESLKEFNLEITLGNHDQFEEAEKWFSTMQSTKLSTTEWFYHRRTSFFDFIFLDSSAEAVSESQLGWLKKTLQHAKNVLLFIHHPILPVRTEIDKRYPLQERTKISNLLKAHPYAVHVFCGHYHMNDVQTSENIVQMITLAASYQVQKSPDIITIDTSTFGYRIIELEDQNIRTKVIQFH